MAFEDRSGNDFVDRKFLLIEDFDVMRGVLRALLKRCGAQRVDTAANAREALQHMQHKK